MPKISIITPFYKGNRFVPMLFEMIKENQKKLQEKYPESEVEFIFVNDSPEQVIDIPKVADEINYKIINQPKNMGIHQARVTGIEHADGEFILFLDQDDEIEKNCLLQQYDSIKDADVVIANAKIEKENGALELLYRSRYEFSKVLNKEFYLKAYNIIVSPGQCLIRREAIPKQWCDNIIRANGSDDLFLWLLMLALEKKMRLNKNVVYTHKYTGENLSSSASKMNKSSLEIVKYMSHSDVFTQRDIKVFKRSREFARDWIQSGRSKKFLLGVLNADILFPRMCWKMKTLISVKMQRK